MFKIVYYIGNHQSTTDIQQFLSLIPIIPFPEVTTVKLGPHVTRNTSISGNSTQLVWHHMHGLAVNKYNNNYNPMTLSENRGIVFLRQLDQVTDTLYE